MPSLFGWGGVMIAGIEFATSYGRLSFEKDEVRNTTIPPLKQILVHSNGWRPVIECELFNLSTADTALFVQLADAISLSQETGAVIGVRPRYLSTDTGSTASYNCFLDSDFSPEDIANVDVGQTIKLRFIGERLTSRIPTNYSGQTDTDFVDDSANKIVDDSGNQIILF